MIDLTKVDYRLTLLPPNGNKIDVTNLLLTAIHEETQNDMAARLKVSMKNIRREDGWIHQHVYLMKRLILEATDGNGWQEIFRGSVFNWKPNANDHTVDIIAYDPLYATMQSEEHYYFTNGLTGADSIKQIASEQGIPVGRIDGPSVPLTKKMYNGKIGQTIANRLKESEEKGSGIHIVRFTKGQMEIVKEGTNNTVYELNDNAVESSSDEHSIENDFVTKVKIYGNESKDARPKVEATVNGDTKFGVIQRILYKSNFDNVGDAKKAADEMLKKDGKPTITRPLVHPDIPWIRKGDKVAVASGTIGGGVTDGRQKTVDCIVESLSRDLESGKMTLKLKGA